MKHISNDLSFTGKWRMAGHLDQCILEIEQTGETYKCVWLSHRENHKGNYTGLGVLVDGKLYISRSLHITLNNFPMGGIGVYKPIGDKRSLAALWAETGNRCSIGSGIAIRKETSNKIEGFYVIRYFLVEHEYPRFDLQIAKEINHGYYNLYWSKDETVFYCGIGMIIDGQLVFAWGVPETEWEVVSLSLEKQEDNCPLLHSKRVSQKGKVLYEKYYLIDV